MQLFTLCSCKWFVFIVLATDAWLWTNVECRVQVLHEQPLQPALTRLSGQLRLVKVKKVTKLLTDDDEHDDTTEHGRAKEPLTSVASDRHHSKLTPKTTHVDLNVKMDAIAFRPMPFLAPQKTTTDLTSDFISKSKPISIPFTTVAPFRIKRPKFELKPKSTSINLPAPNRPLKVKTNDALNVKLKNRAKQTKSNASMGMRKETKFAKSNSNSNANRESKKLEKIHKTSATNSNHRKALQSKVEDKKIDYDSIRAKLNLQKKTQKAIDSSSSYNYSIQRAREEKGEKKKKTGSGSTSASKPKYASTQTLKPNHEAKSQKSVQTKAPSTTMNRAKEQGDLQQENSNTFRKYAKLSFRGESSRKVAVATDLATTSTSTTTESPTTRTWSRSNGERPSTFDRQPANDSNRFGLSRKRKRFGSESIKSENDRAKSSQAVTTTERSFTTAESVKRDIFKFRSRKHLEGPKYPRFQSTTTSQPSIITTSIKTKFEANAKDDNDLIGSNEIVKSKDQGPAKFGLMATRRKPLRKFLRSSAGFEATVQPFSTRSKNPLASGITSTTTSTTTTTTTTAVPTTTTSTESSVFTRRPRIRRPTPETGSRALQTTLITTSTSTSTITPISSIIRNARRFQHSLPSVVVESGLFDERDQNTLKSRYSNATEYKLRRPTLEPDSMMMSPRSKPTEPSSKLHYSAPQRAPPLQSPSSHQNENVIDDTAEKSTSLPVAPSSSVRQNVFDSQRIRNIDRTPSYEVITKFAPESKDVLPAQNAYHTKSSQTENDYSHRPDYLIENEEVGERDELSKNRQWPNILKTVHEPNGKKVAPQMYSTPNKVFRNQAPIPYIAPQHHDDLLEVRRFEKILKLRAMNRNIAQKLPNQKYEPPTKRLDHDKHWPKVTYDSQDVDANSVVSLQTTALPKSRKHRHMPASNSKPMSPFTLYQNDSPSKFVVTSSAMIHNFAPKVIYSSIESNGRRFEKGSGPRSPNVQQNWPFKYDHDRSPTSDHMHLLQHSVIQHQVPQPIYSGNAFEPLAANADEDGQRPQMQIHYSPYQNDALK